MELASPAALLLVLAAVPLVLAARRPAPAIAVPRLAGLEARPSTLRERISPWLWLLEVLAIVLLVVAIARPRAGLAAAVAEAEGVDLVLVLDASSSMETTRLGSGSRLDAAKRVVSDFVEGRENDRIGIVVFQRDALTLAPLTLDHRALVEALEAVDSGLMPDGTGIGVGIGEALNLLRDSAAASRAVILLTDGNHNTDSISPEDAAALAAAMRIRVYTVGLKAAGGADLFGREVDEERLQAIAERTGARYFLATTEPDLAGIYEEIGRLETSRLPGEGFLAYREYGPWLALAAALVLLLEAGLRLTVLRRLPR